MITLNPANVGWVVQLIGGIIILYSVFKVENLKFFALLLGVGLIYGGSQLSSAVPSPGPGPGPGPGPPPPVGAFAQNVKSAFRGTVAEAQVLGALHEAVAVALEFDGSRSQPRIKNTTQLGELFAEIQRYRGGSETPWSNRFPELQRVLYQEAISRGVIDQGKTTPLDANRRNIAVNYFREVGNILGGM